MSTDERKNVVEFTMGLMDRLREVAGLSALPKTVDWIEEDNIHRLDWGFVGAVVSPVKIIHTSAEWWKVELFEPNRKAVEYIGRFSSAALAKRYAEYWVRSLMRGVAIEQEG